MIFSIATNLSMIETPILSVNSIKIGSRTTTKVSTILVKLMLQNFRVIILVFQMLGKELLQ